ncbi:MAG: hypothetical protein ABI579_09180, partial [Candidatus Sumerlaeota bacterium]
NGRAIIWEKNENGYFLRPFPIGENIFEHVLPRTSVNSIADDSSSAALVIAGKETTVAPLDFVQVPLGGKTYIDGIAGTVNAKWHEVVIDAGGKKLVVAMLPPEVSSKPITGESRQEVRVRMLAKYLSSLSGVKITPGTVSGETGMFAADNTPFGEVWDKFLGDHEWKYRWVGEDEIFLDYPENLVTPEFDAKRREAK